MLRNVLECSSPCGHLYVYSFVHCTVSQSCVSGSELVCVSLLVVHRLACKLCSLSQILLFGSIAYVSLGGLPQLSAAVTRIVHRGLPTGETHSADHSWSSA